MYELNFSCNDCMYVTLEKKINSMIGRVRFELEMSYMETLGNVNQLNYEAFSMYVYNGEWNKHFNMMGP